MKVERENIEVFKPIVITLENKEEANRFWHLVNAAAGRSLNTYVGDGENGTPGEVEAMKHNLFDMLDCIHRPYQEI